MIVPPVATPEIKEDFKKFLFFCWAHLNLPKPTPVQYDIADYLQKGPRRCIVQAYRGCGKSWITSAFVLWRLLNNPNEKILVVSASKDRADAFSTFTKRLIAEMEMLAHLMPNAKKGQRDSNVAFDVGPATADHAPSVKSVGINGQLAGSRANLIIADDIEVANNSLTQLMRDRLSESVKEFDAILKPGGRVIYLGTPQTEMSVYNVVRDRGYDIRIWPVRYPKEKLQENYGTALSPWIARNLERDPTLLETTHSKEYGKPVDPDRFDEFDLMERYASYGKSGFALQFMLDTTVSDQDRYPLKLSDLMVMGTGVNRAPFKVDWGSGPNQLREDIPNLGLAGDRIYRPAFIHNEFAEYQGKVMFIDPSGRGKDETGYAVVAMLNGILYVRDIGGFAGGYEPSVLEALAKICERENINNLRIESNFGDGMFGQLFRPVLRKIHRDIYDEEATEVRHSQQKELRILDTLEPVLASHRLVFDEDAMRRDTRTENPKHSCCFQLTRITRDKGALAHDDRLDALAGAVGFWTAKMKRDADDFIETKKRKERDDEINAFIRRAKGRVQTTNWTGVR